MSIFISYRRDKGKPVAEAIYQNLCNEYNIFLDTESLKNGYFDSAIVDRIESCSDFIAIITNTVFDRCSDPNDWIFHEIQLALQSNKNIIPVFVETQSFPANVPKPLKEICRLNGIFWSNDIHTFEKIKSFLISNKRYTLSVVPNKNHINLSPHSKKEPHELYQRFLKYGRSPVNIELQVTQLNDFSGIIIEKEIVLEYGTEFAMHVANQSLIKKIKGIKNVLEAAIEYMLQDEMLDDCALKLRKFYIKKYGISNCVFTDTDGIESFYWTPFLWIDIIEELLKEILNDRYYLYGSCKDLACVSCYIEDSKGNELWHFLSFISKQYNNDIYEDFLYMLTCHQGKNFFTDIPLHDLAFHVFPDFYYNIGLLKNNKTIYSFEEIKTYKNVFNLQYYSIGLH